MNYLDVELNEDCGTWGSEEITGSQFVEVFPNPAKDRINLRFGEAGSSDASICMYDMTGRLVYAANTTDQAVAISTFDLPNGLYTLVIQTCDERVVERVMVSAN